MIILLKIKIIKTKTIKLKMMKSLINKEINLLKRKMPIKENKKVGRDRDLVSRYPW